MIDAHRVVARLGPFRWRAVAPARATRAVAPVVLPLVAAAATGHLADGIFASIGALSTGFASLQGVNRTRLESVLIAAVGVAVATFVGGVTARTTDWLVVPAAAVFAYVAGLAVALGPARSVALLQWPVALLVAIGLPLSPALAAQRAGWAFAGGLLQALVVVTSWAVGARRREHRALAATLRDLARYADAAAGDDAVLPDPSPLAAEERIADPNPLLAPVAGELLGEFVERAHTIRTALVALAAEAWHRDDEQARAARRTAEAVADALEAAADALDAAAESLAAGPRERARWLARWRPLDVGIDATGPLGDLLRQQVEALPGLVERLAAIPAGTLPDRLFGGAQPDAPGWRTLRAEAGLDNEIGRHALRLAVTVAAAAAIAVGSRLPEGRWIALTSLIVLKPDYASTVVRGLQRAAGTAVGAVGIGAAAGLLGRLGSGASVFAACSCLVGSFVLFDVSYLLFSVAQTAFIVVLLDLLGFAANATADARLLDTAIGAALAFAAYRVWPTWHREAARATLLDLVRAHADYVAALLDEAAAPGAVGPEELRRLQLVARRARARAELSARRLADEPVASRLPEGYLDRLFAGVARLIPAELALHSLLSAPTPGTAALRRAAGTVAAAFESLQQAAAATDPTLGR